jgi:aldose 1-epimerase
VLLGYGSMEQYLAKPQFFGATVGRFANRLAGGRFRLDGQGYQTPTNDGKNALHGGTIGFDKVLWEVVSVRNGPSASVTLRYVSPDGDQGYPGTMTVEATYTLDERDQLTIDYVATADKPTIANITNHAYWNLSGEGSARGAMGHRVTIPAQTYLPTDAGAIPTGRFQSVAGTAFDFRTPHAVGERVRDAGEEQLRFGRGYDHNWVIGRAVTPEQHLMARVYDPASGRGFELWSNQPGLQFYSGNFLDATSSGKAGRLYREGDAIVLEPQIFPDSPNQKGFPDATLRPGQTYHNIMTYRLRSGQPARRGTETPQR